MLFTARARPTYWSYKQIGKTLATMTLVLTAAGNAADTDIHRCELEDGTVAFQEMPCPEPTVRADDGSKATESHDESSNPAAGDDVFVNPFDEPADPEPPVDPPLPEALTADRTECEKTTRDAIDEIDLEMRGNAYTKEQGEEYLEDLLALTRQLRACKQL